MIAAGVPEVDDSPTADQIDVDGHPADRRRSSIMRFFFAVEPRRRLEIRESHLSSFNFIISPITATAAAAAVVSVS